MSAEPDDDPAPIGPPVDRFDMEIVEFILSWAPYGGPPADECVPRFGMTCDRLLVRFREIVDMGERRHLGQAELATLKRATELLDIGSVDAGQPRGRRCDAESPSVGRWMLRQGVWRWK